MNNNDSRLTRSEEGYVARHVELDLRSYNDDELGVDLIQRALEGAAAQSRDNLWKRASYGSDASIRRILAEVRAIRQDRADTARALELTR